MAAPYFEFSDRLASRSHSPRGQYERWGKRALDLVLVLAMLPVALPVMLLCLGLAALSVGNPIYGQMRVGQNGRLFRMWKIRTMRRDADRSLTRILQDDPVLADEWKRNQKLRNDPRVTRIGGLLRRTSLDELPQLLNVALGQMSLVGPRPFLPEQRDLYDAQPGAAAYYAMRPGLTGLWQVGPRNDTIFAKRVRADRLYADRVSLRTDLGIIWRTILAVLRATGL
ncbi:lipopolysaccharide/colanic/teichoic acid biosynthesis glycosyltransferase [Albidovulum inexpectatum]|uniref:Lipopolysaccharide/colanic/teichoic acid biosynthesis glycosyltransferase n=1 Tax=Albidovulum inexpectatum TaxID=196587 RepID=A0A2S5JN47_9RHOB|nr:sugar transferase [Albidovulum inexpectatum]PPB82665.1 lipopolysaccharide/colanic/teichoic acid biosynthesis glycosyltransferase [Albidovulum inexpectatum]